MKKYIRYFFYLLFLLFAYYTLIKKLKHTSSWTDGTLEINHALLMHSNFTNNEQSRLFQFLVPESFIQLFDLSIINAYILQRLLFTWLTFCVFYQFMLKWFSEWKSFLGILLFALIIPTTYQNDLQESTSLLLLTFIAGLWAIREKKYILFSIILIFGGINNETMLFLPLILFLSLNPTANLTNLLSTIRKTFIYSVPAFLIVGSIRFHFRHQPHLGGVWHWPDNMSYILTRIGLPDLNFYNISFLIVSILSGLWIYFIFKYYSKELFLKHALLSIPFFIIPHLLTGIISEYRQMLPLLLILIPVILYAFSKKPNTI